LPTAFNAASSGNRPSTTSSTAPVVAHTASGHLKGLTITPTIANSAMVQVRRVLLMGWAYLISVEYQRD
jgi:hypothetical protein